MSANPNPQAGRSANVLLSMYVTAELRVASVLRRALGTDLLASRRYQRALVAEIRTVLQALAADTPSLAQQAVLDSYGHGADVLARRAAGLPEQSSFGLIRRQTLATLTDNLTHDLASARDVIGRRSAGLLRREGLRAVTRQAIAELPRDAASSLLQQRLERQGITGFVDRAGRQWTLANYAQMALRTTTAEAQTAGVRNAMLAKGLDLVYFPPHEHHHDICSQYEGRTASLTGRTPGYPVLPLPPWHPNCTHYAVPAPENFVPTDPTTTRREVTLPA